MNENLSHPRLQAVESVKWLKNGVISTRCTHAVIDRSSLCGLNASPRLVGEEVSWHCLRGLKKTSANAVVTCKGCRKQLGL